MSTLELSVIGYDAVIANIKEFDARTRRELRRVTKEHGLLCRDLTRFFAPRESGFMGDHVQTVFFEDGMIFETGWSADDFYSVGKQFYPFYQEYGTFKMPANPSLGPAADEVMPAYERAIDEAIRASVARANR